MATKTELQATIEQLTLALSIANERANALLSLVNAQTSEELETLNVSNVQIYVLKERVGKTIATARCMLHEQFQITGLRIIDGSNGLFIAYPYDPTYEGDDYRSLMYPVTKDLRDAIEKTVLKKYEEIISTQY